MGNFAASVKDWAERSKANQMQVVQLALQKTLTIPTQLSMARGAASVKQGAIPVDIGHLVNTRASENGGGGDFAVDQEGAPFTLTIDQMQAGDVAYFAWTSAYALAIEYGHGTYPGAHFLSMAAARWPENVAEAAREIKP